MKGTKKVSKSDVKEGYEFNWREDGYKNGKTAVLRVWKDKDKADLHYHQQGNYYPPEMSNKPIHIRPRFLINPQSDWLFKNELKQSLSDDELDQLDKFYKEYKEEFWQDVKWLNQIKDKMELGNSNIAKKLEDVKFKFVE